jgi:FKBP-type peptidyl-prolyl cis-trans isomerase FkpA
MSHILTAVAVWLTCAPAFAADTPTLTEEQKTLYAIGVSVSRSLNVFDLSPAEFDYVKQGLADAQAGKAETFDLTAFNVRIQELAKSRRKASAEKQVGAGKDFMEKAAKEKGAIKTASGMIYTSLAEGKGESPKATDVVTVHYRGTLVDGKEFDSSYKRGKPLEFQLENVIKCWIEGVQKMKPGGKAKLVCPPDLAYGDSGAGELILPGATLAFDIELLDVKPAAAIKGSSAAPVPSAAPFTK